MAEDARAAPETPPYREIDAAEAQRLIEGGAVVIDVRQPHEWRSGHIPSARLLPLDGIYTFGRAAAELPHDIDLVFVCEVGQRSSVASEIALIAGCAPAHVYNLAGGMSAWRRLQLPLER